MRSFYILLFIVISFCAGLLTGIKAERFGIDRERDNTIRELTELNQQRIDNEQRLTETVEQQRTVISGLEEYNRNCLFTLPTRIASGNAQATHPEL